MQQNGKNTVSAEAFILGSVIQVSFRPANTGNELPKRDPFPEVATVVLHEGIEQCLCRGFFLPVQVANGGVSARHCATGL